MKTYSKGLNVQHESTFTRAQSKPSAAPAKPCAIIEERKQETWNTQFGGGETRFKGHRLYQRLLTSLQAGAVSFCNVSPFYQLVDEHLTFPALL